MLSCFLSQRFVFVFVENQEGNIRSCNKEAVSALADISRMAKLAGLSFLVICSLILPFTWQKKFEPTWESLDKHVAPLWYDEAKFGIFMTWGLYSVPSFGTYSEWFWNNWKGTDLTNLC